jgi:tRNA nucleotidyltransferase (CCA-adding enzyme)
MASPVRTVRPDISMDEAGRIMLRHFLDGLVVMLNEEIVGIVSQRDVDKARHHKLGHASVKGFMSHPVYTVSENSPLSEIQTLMVAHDIGRLPVLNDEGKLVGIVGRRELLLALYGEDENAELKAGRLVPKLTITGTEALLERIDPQLLLLYKDVGAVAAELNMVAYLVGGCVRDLILDRPNYDIDIVVEGSARDLAKGLVKEFPNNYELVVEHARFNTATLYVYNQNRSENDGAVRREVDIATARTEYYEYPAALPTVEPSSLEQDLFRRDFTINSLAMCLHPDRLGEIVDYFNGLADLNSGTVRILHPFSFIEDPTRIVRAARFAARFDFKLEARSRMQAERAINLGIFDNLGGIRLKAELRYILESHNRLKALDLLQELGGGLRFIDADIKYDKKVRLHIRRAEKVIANYPQLNPFVVYLGVLCYGLEESKLMEALRRLHLAEDECSWIRDAQVILRGLLELNPNAKRSELYEVLQGHNEHSLAIAVSVAPMASNLRRSIRLYFEELKDVRSDFRGDDLIKLGIPAGPQVGQILQRLKNARLDRELNNYEEEKNFVLTNYLSRESR